MTEKKNADVEKKADAENKAEKPLPAFVKAAPELLPLWDWWVKEGKTVMVTLVVVALGVAGFFGIRGYLHGRQAKATAALMNANTLEELTRAVSEGGGTGAKLRLAKYYYDARQYQEALDQYASALKEADKDDPFLDIAELGRAHALEGLKNYAEASEAFSAYASSEAKSHDGFRLTAQLGAARCKAHQGDVKGAESDLKALKEATADEMDQQRIESLLELLKHYDFSRQDSDPTEALTLSEDDADSVPATQTQTSEEPAANAEPKSATQTEKK